MKITNTDGRATRNKATFSMEYKVGLSIHASADRIWSILTDGAAYPSWNSTVERVEGKIGDGNKVKVFAKISPDRAFPVNVDFVEPGKQMVWKSGIPLGIFKAKRSFLLDSQDENSTDVYMIEQFTGLMLPAISGSIPDLRPAFEGFIKDLKTEAEK